jgi:ABC-2 type transport system permease protein
LGLARIVFWKEVLELSRDTRTLAIVVLMPLLGMPSLALVTGLLYTQQQAVLGVYYEDPEAQAVASRLAAWASDAASASGLRLEAFTSQGRPRPGCCDVVIYLPGGFYSNLTSLDSRAVVIVARLIASPAADAAYSAALNALGRLSAGAARARVQELATRAGVAVDPEAVLHPLDVREELFKPTGAPATPQEARAAETARFLEFALIFVVNPAVVYITDAIIGERERRTIEALLVTPMGLRDIVLGKLAASSLLGFVAAMADTAGVLAFFALAGGGVAASPGLLAVHATVSGLLVLMTASLVAPVAARSETARSAQAVSMALLGAATAVYFAALFTDISSLPPALEAPLLALPFTHAALAIQSYASGEAVRSIVYLAVMGAFTLAGILASVKLVDKERLVMLRE